MSGPVRDLDTLEDMAVSAIVAVCENNCADDSARLCAAQELIRFVRVSREQALSTPEGVIRFMRTRGVSVTDLANHVLKHDEVG
jgi:hypothetical protein